MSPEGDRAKSNRVTFKPDQIPPSTTGFQGRENELASIRSWLSNDRVRLVGITSAGGYGKSTLAAEVYGEVTTFERSLWVSFEQPRRFSLFGRWLLEQFGIDVDEKAGDDALINQVIYCLSQKRCLLVMDNVESLLQDRQWQEEAYQTFLLKWLGRENNSVLILTSRDHPVTLEQRRVENEWIRLKGLDETDGIKLLRDQGIAGAEIGLKRLVKLADGHPLLLKLAASWLKDQPVHIPDVSNILTQENLNLFEQLVGTHRDVETSVGRLLAESLNRLESRLRHLWLNLSVYRLPFNLAGAQVMSSEPVTEKELRGLVRRSLLEEQPDQGEWQFKFLPLLKDFAQKQADDQTVAHHRAITYYCSITKPKPWETEKDASACIERVYHHCQLKQCTQAFSTIFMCDKFLELKGRYTTRVELYEQLLQALELTNAERQEHRNCLISLGNSYLPLGQYDQAIKSYQQWLMIAKEMSDREGEVDALKSLGNAHESSRQYDRAIEFYQQSLAIIHEIGNCGREASVLNNLGNTYESLGQYEQAIKLHQQSLKITHRQSLEIIYKKQALQGKARSLNNLGTVYNSLESYEQAIKFFKQSLRIRRRIFDRQGEANSFNNQGTAYLLLKQYNWAIECYQQAIEVYCDIGEQRGKAYSMFHLGNALKALNHFSEAKSTYQDARTLFQVMGLEAEAQDCEAASEEVMTIQLQTMMNDRCHVTRSQIVDFCQRWRVIEFAVFGSVLRDDFHDGSDIDVLVTLAPNHGLNLFDWIDMQQELEALFSREVDLVDQRGLKNPYRRSEIMNTRQIIYASEQP